MGRTLMLLASCLLTLASALDLSGNSAVEDSRTMSRSTCERVPAGLHSAKSPGSNGFVIKISGNPEKYVPGEGYTISLHGFKSPNMVQKFTGFMLVAEPKIKVRLEDSGSPGGHDVGFFQLYGDALSKFSENCPHAIVQTTQIPKSEIQVMWRAPPSGSGCIVFRATVVEHRDIWYMDDSGLTKELCEEEQESQDEQPDVLDECCACDEAKYELTFEGLWSRHTHPKDFPHGQLTHFSDIIGASHTSDYRIWEYNGYASEGVRQVAEMGATRKLESELKAESGKIRTIIKARGLFFPNVTGKTFAVFRVDKQHHVMSLLSMLGPSPDWIVGVSALELCLKNCSWLTEKVMNLYPWDSGTDDGISYISPNSPTNPRERIRRITSSNPDNPDSPFYDSSGIPMKPVARLTVTRQRVYEKSCEDTVTIPPDDVVTEVYGPECAVTEWTSFTQCSNTCGKGVQMRTRSYLNEHKAHIMGCKVKMVEKEICESNCVGNVSCETTEWSDWTECSVTCGKGFKERVRKYKHPKARKVCANGLEERELCMASIPECKTTEVIDPRCAVTQWSEWSPCTVSCGKGLKIRTRLYINPSALSHCNVERMQKAPCTGSKNECKVDINEAKEICLQPKEVGPCRGYFPRWYYHAARGMCLQFIYGGCRGNNNNFERYPDCSGVCEQVQASVPPLSTSAQPPGPSDQPIIDCVVTPWSEWTPCSRTCNSGRKERRRMIKLNPQNGGKPCPRKLVQRRKCKENPPCPGSDDSRKGWSVDCLMTAWSEWSTCSVTCGQGGFQKRTRTVKRVPKHGGPSCGPTKEERICSLPACTFY